MDVDVVTLKQDRVGEPDCKACPLGEKKSRTCVPGYFPTERYCGLAFVGEQPWKEEAKAGFPFVGASGRLLWSICKTLGIPQDQVLVLNAISCFAGEWPTGAAEKKAKAAARTACRPMLLKALADWKPKVIVALGGEAIRSLLDDEAASVKGYRGTVNRFGDAWLTAAEHPAAILRSNGFTAPLLKKDLAKAWRWLFEGAPREWSARIEAAPSVERTRELCARWRHFGHVVGDVETIPSGGRWHDPLRLLGLGDEDIAAWWPFFDAEWRTLYGERAWFDCRAELRALLADASVTKTFHNKQYDLAVLENHGFPVAGPVDDTMVMHHDLHLRDVPHDLGYVAAEFLDVPAWKKEFKKEWEAPIGTLGDYNGNDVLATARVKPHLLSALQSRQLLATYEMDNRGTDVALDMNRNGIWIDEYRRQQYLREYDAKAAELEVQVLELSGAAAKQLETLELVEASGALVWGAVKLKDVEAGARPDVEELANVCELVSGRVLQTATAADLEESARKLRELAAVEGWKPWMPLDPAGDSAALKKQRKPITNAATGAATVGNEAEFQRLTNLLQQNADARVAAGRACAVVRSAVLRVQKALSQPIVNLDAAQQMGQIIHSPKWCGLPVAVPSEREGEYLTNEEALYHVSWHPVVKTWQEWGSAAYRRDWLRHTLPISADGRAHGAFKTTRTPNARWAGGADGEAKWNPQNPEKATIDIFAARPGYRLVGRDFSMIEIRVAAALSGDKRMIQQITDFDEGRTQWDIHQQRAIRCWPEFPKLEPEVQKKKRNLAKRANFGPIYGASKYMLLPVMLSQLKPLENLAENKRRTEELLLEAQRILDDIHADWTELFLWLEEGYRNALRTGYLKNGYVSGRTIHFPLRDRDHVERRFCYNAPVQGCIPAFTKVFTREGLLPIGEILKTGDVWTGTRWAPYTRVCRGDWELAEIRLSNGQTFQCDTRHEVLVEGVQDYEFRKFENIQPGDRVCFTAPQPIETLGNGLPNELAYWLGFFIGNGSTGGERWQRHKNAMGVTIGVRKGRYSITQKFVELENFILRQGFFMQKPRRDSGPQGGRLTVTVESAAFRALLESYGYPWGAGAHDKRVPTAVWSAGLAARKAFLLGLLDADGCIAPSKKTKQGGANLHMSNREFLSEVQQLFRTVGVRGTLRGPYNYASAPWTSWRLDLNVAQLAAQLGYGSGTRRAARQRTVPRFVVEKFLQQLGTIPKFSECASASDATLFSRMKHGGSTNVYVLVDMARRYLQEPFEVYDSEAVVTTRQLGVVAPTYTLCVDDPGHRFDSEGVISKNTAREIVMSAMLRIDKRKHPAALWVMDAHDQLLIECPEELAEDTHEIMKEEMQGWLGPVRILSDGGAAGGIARTWKELK